jgi:hypothetical protein
VRTNEDRDYHNGGCHNIVMAAAATGALMTMLMLCIGGAAWIFG